MRYKATPEGNVPFTEAEELEWDAQEAANLAAAPARAKAALAALAAEAQAALVKIDAASVRSIREFLLAKFPGDPLLPKDKDGKPVLPALDAEARKERATLK